MLSTRLEHEVHPTVYLTGEMDLDCADELRGIVGQAAEGAERVVLDFAEVRFIDSSGTGIFVRLCLDLRAQGVALRARNVPPVVAQVFDMLKVGALIGDETFAA